MMVSFMGFWRGTGHKIKPWLEIQSFHLPPLSFRKEKRNRNQKTEQSSLDDKASIKTPE